MKKLIVIFILATVNQTTVAQFFISDNAVNTRGNSRKYLNLNTQDSFKHKSHDHKILIHDIDKRAGFTKYSTALQSVSSDSDTNAYRDTKQSNIQMDVSKVTKMKVLTTKAYNYHIIRSGDPVELSFIASNTSLLSPPKIYDMRLRVTFYNSDIDSVVVDGFWAGRVNGLSIWKARFHPPKWGLWRWQTTFSDTKDINLHNRTGEVIALEDITNQNVFDQKGWLRVAKSGRHLEHENGDPFFWQGDTAWEIVWKSTLGQVDLYLKDRKSKGYNSVYLVVQSHQFLYDWGVMNRENQPLFLQNDYSQINPFYFDYLDKIVSRINEAGLIAVIVPLWASLSEVHHNPNEHRRTISIKQSLSLARYVGARYAGHNVVWIIGGDNNYDTVEKRLFWSEFSGVLSEASGGRHLRTVHPSGYNASFDFFDFNTPWIDFHMYHSSHLKNSGATTILGKKGWEFNPPKPIINGEPAFEDIPAYFWASDTTIRITDYDVRQAVWQSFLSGALMGVTYGANGVWQWHVPKLFASHNPQQFVTEALNLPGARQISLIKTFFKDIKWWNIKPDPSLANSEHPELKPIGATLDEISWIYVPKGLYQIKLKNIFNSQIIIIKYRKPDNLVVSRIDTLLYSDTNKVETLWIPSKSDWLLEIIKLKENLSTTHLNQLYEITLYSENNYQITHPDVSVSTTFFHKSGESQTVNAFWLSDSTWKVRFKPWLFGTWSWQTTSSDSLNIGLHKRRGAFNVVNNRIDFKDETDKVYIRSVSPNPFNPSTQITFELLESSIVTIDIHTIDGRLVQRLVENKYSVGLHTATFYANGLSSGIYLARVKSSFGIKTVKMTLLK